MSSAEPISAELLRDVTGELAPDTEVLVIVVVNEHERGERDYREDGSLADQVRERFGVPVDAGVVSR